MTCIVGLVKNDQVYMGGDSAGVTPQDRITMALEAAAHHSSGVCAPFVIEGPEETNAKS